MEHSDIFNLNKPISGESYFSTPEGKLVAVEDYGPLDKSAVWYLNHLFWKHFDLWQATYDEHYEASLPSGVSQSHTSSFVNTSALKFFNLLCQLESEGKLPMQINILEEGPGTGIYARKFLDHMREWSRRDKKSFYDRICYTLYDTSSEILVEAAKNLLEHKKHIKTTTQFPSQNQFLYARHSNLWDQLPVRLFQNCKGQTHELEARLGLDNKLAKYLQQSHPNYSFKDIASALKERRIEKIILDEPRMWKPIIRAIRLELKPTKISQAKQTKLPYQKTFQRLTKLHHDQEFSYSPVVLGNLEQIFTCINWGSGGYVEIVDIIAPDYEAFAKPRRPVKFDGSLGAAVNGLMLRTYLGQQQKHLFLKKIKGLNHVATIQQYSLKALVTSNTPVIIAEVAATTKETPDQTVEHSNKLLAQKVDIISFSDQAFVKKELSSLSQLVQSKIFKQLPGNATMPIIKTRTKTRPQIEKILASLKSQNVSNSFVVTGDPAGLESDEGLTSLDVIPLAKNAGFYTGSVAHPQASDIAKMKAKIKAGTDFFIMQATYDQSQWQAWLEKIKSQNLHQQSPLIATVIPLTSKRALEVVSQAVDIELPASIAKQFEQLEPEVFRQAGLVLAKEMAKSYLESGVFAGVYLYSRSPPIVHEMSEFIDQL